MSSFYKEISSQIITSEEYAHASDELFEAYISKIASADYEIDKKTIKQLSTSIQFFYRSDFEEYLNEGAILLSMLLHVSGEQTHELVAIADNVFSQSGDFPNMELLKEKFPKIRLFTIHDSIVFPVKYKEEVNIIFRNFLKDLL
jgi:hypothetical protein